MAIRDDFSSKVVLVLRERVAGFCSNPKCRCSTTGPNEEVSQATRVGVAAHISAASPGGPRYDTMMTTEERSSASNGIWLCATCARRIDVDSTKFTRELLLSWKKEAEEEADQQLGKPRPMQLDNHVEEQAFPFICPHCHTGFSRGQTVCRGCRGQIVEGATKEERKTVMITGAALVVLPLLFVYSKFGIKLLPTEGNIVSNIPLFFLAISGFMAAYYAISFEEKRRRKNNPRVFVRTYV